MHTCEKCGDEPASACDDGTVQCKACRKVTGAQLMDAPVGRRKASKKAEQAAKARKAAKAKAAQESPAYSAEKVRVVVGKEAVDPTQHHDAKKERVINLSFELETSRLPKGSVDWTSVARQLDEESLRRNDGDHSVSVEPRSVPPLPAACTPEVLSQLMDWDALQRGWQLNGGGVLNKLPHPDFSDAPAVKTRRALRAGYVNFSNYMVARANDTAIVSATRALDGMSKLLHAMQHGINADVADAVGDVALALHVLCNSRGLSFDQCVDSNLIAWASKQASTKESDDETGN